MKCKPLLHTCIAAFVHTINRKPHHWNSAILHEHHHRRAEIDRVWSHACVLLSRSKFFCAKSGAWCAGADMRIFHSCDMPVTGDPERAGRAVIRGRKIMETHGILDLNWIFSIMFLSLWNVTGVAQRKLFAPGRSKPRGEMVTSPPPNAPQPPTGKNNA